MKRAIGAAVLLGLSLGWLASCSSSGSGSVQYYGSVYFGYGYYDPWYWRHYWYRPPYWGPPVDPANHSCRAGRAPGGPSPDAARPACGSAVRAVYPLSCSCSKLFSPHPTRHERSVP